MSEHDEVSASASSGKLWGGRFSGGVDPRVDRYTRSFGFDRRLATADVIGCLAHARMSWERGVLDDSSARRILEGLGRMHSQLEEGSLEPDGDDEDIHSWIERTLTERIGEPARRLHTGRSRNDQTATALRLYLRGRLGALLRQQLQLAETLLAAAREHRDVVLPGYTHLQRAQPVSLAHHLLAHAWLLEADGERLMRAHRLAGRSPLGAAALAGTPHAIDPARSAELLGFEDVFPNSMHAVADRDYVLESSFACTLVMVHLSRWAEEMILWSSSEFGFVQLDDSVAKGSSIMPQKKNPEALEILRGRSGRVIGDLVAHLVQLKGLPLTYNSDLQEDKEALFDALDTTETSLEVATVVLRASQFDAERMSQALRGGFVTATDLADALVRRGLPFRDAHEQTGAAVRLAEAHDCEMWELSWQQLREVCPDLQEEDLLALQPENSLAAHDSAGGPAPRRVDEQIERLEASLALVRDWLDRQREPPILRWLREGSLLDRELDTERDCEREARPPTGEEPDAESRDG